MLIHHDRWEELGPELEAFGLLSEVDRLLLGRNAVARKHVANALRTLHPATRSPEAREEYALRERGEDLKAAEQQARSQSDFDRAVADAVARALKQRELEASNEDPGRPE